MAQEIVGICPKCKSEKKLLARSFQGKNIVGLCQTCENEIFKEEISCGLLSTERLVKTISVFRW